MTRKRRSSAREAEYDFAVVTETLATKDRDREELLAQETKLMAKLERVRLALRKNDDVTRALLRTSVQLLAQHVVAAKED